MTHSDDRKQHSDKYQSKEFIISQAELPAEHEKDKDNHKLSPIQLY